MEGDVTEKRNKGEREQLSCNVNVLGHPVQPEIP